MAIINQNRTEYCLLFRSILFCIITIAIFIPYYYVNYKSSQDDKDNLRESVCEVKNQTENYKYACQKTFYNCGCQQQLYYPCSYILTNHMHGYCCEPICQTNSSINSLNFVECGYNIIFTTKIENSNNVTNIFNQECKYNDNKCIQYWKNLIINPFECYYLITNPDKILLSKPDFIELYSVGFIFAYICAAFVIIFLILSIYFYKKNNNGYEYIN
jgi:hypothetical protein